jgi:hypothetical protein
MAKAAFNKKEVYFQQQIGLEFKEETSEIPPLDNNDGSTASAKASSPHSATWYLLFQLPVPSLILMITQYLLTCSSSSRHPSPLPFNDVI